MFITAPDNGRHSQRFRNAAIRETKLEEASKDRFVPFFRKGFRERWEKQMSRKEERKGKGWRGNTRDYAIKSIFGWRRRVKDKITLNQAFSPIIGHPFPFTGWAKFLSPVTTIVYNPFVAGYIANDLDISRHHFENIGKLYGGPRKWRLRVISNTYTWKPCRPADF